MSLADAKIILADVLEKEVDDSIITKLSIKDSINTNTINLQVSKIRLMTMKEINLSLINIDDKKIITNKTKEILILNDTIDKQKKEIRKQKTLKIIGFVSAIVLPITTLILLAK